MSKNGEYDNRMVSFYSHKSKTKMIHYLFGHNVKFFSINMVWLKAKLLILLGIFLGVIHCSYVHAMQSEQKEIVFEGTLLYITNEYHSEAIKKYSSGNAYNGTRNIKIVLKGNVIHITDLDMHIHQYIDKGSQKAVLYSDITNEGIDCGIGYMDMIRQQFAPESAFYNVDFQNAGQIDYKGDLCQIMKSTLTGTNSGSNTSGGIEIWYSNSLKTTDVYSYYSYGAVVPGIIKKWVWATNTPSPVGDLRSVVSAELMAIDRHDVQEEEINVPSNIIMLKGNTINIVPEFYAKNTKALKKKKILPKEENKETVLKISEEWSFVKQWEEEIGEPSKLKPMFGMGYWAKVGKGLISDATKIVDLLSNKSQDDTEVTEVSSTGGSSSSLGSKGKKVNHANWQSLENSYSNYESQLSKMRSDGRYDKQDVKNIQRKMKEIRRKITEQSGHERAASELENWNP